MFPKEEVPIGDVVLSVKNLTLDGVFRDVSFRCARRRDPRVVRRPRRIRSLQRRRDALRVTPASSGTIAIDGKEVVIDSANKAIRHRWRF